MFSFGFKRRVSLESQLQELSRAGIVLRPGVSLADLLTCYSRQALESEPYKHIVEVLAMDVEREPYSPVCDRLWMCDYERIEDHGAYQQLLQRLEAMHGLGLQNIQDSVDVEQGQAWVSFDHQAKSYHWVPKVDNDWLDPEILLAYDQLLLHSGQGVRLYANQADFGQCALLGVFSPAQFQVFRELSKFKMGLMTS